MSAKERENKKNARKLVKQEQAKKKLVAKQRVKQERATQKAAKKQPAQQKKAVSKPPKQQYGKKKTQLSEFQRLVATFSSEEQKLLREYFQQLDQHILLPKEWKLPMLHDFEQGILYHLQKGRPLAETLKLLDPLNLGGFYSRPATTWWPLDNAAKVYPISMTRWRFSAFPPIWMKISCRKSSSWR